MGRRVTLTAPVALSDPHDCAQFESGVTTLNDWLKRRARANQASGASRTFVICEGARVVGYFALAAGSVVIAAAPGRFRRNMPEPIPVAVLGRLAVDRARQGQGLGRAMFRNAALRVLNAAESIGIRGVLVHAISTEARAFYLALGFDPSPLDEMTLMAAMGDVEASAAQVKAKPRR